HHLLGGVAKVLDAELEELDHGRWDGECGRPSPLELPNTVSAPRPAFFDEGSGELAGKEGVALRAAGDLGEEAGSDGVGREVALDELAECVRVEAVEGDVAGELLAAQGGEQLAEASGKLELLVAIGED